MKLYFPLFLILICLILRFLPDHPKYVVSQDVPLQYGSHGLLLAKTLKKTKKYRVAFIGNSVLQEFIHNEISLAFSNNRSDVEVINFSMIGATIADYVILYQFIKDFDIDLLVVHYAYHTFISEPPIFKSKVNEFIFHPKLKDIRFMKEFWQEFSAEDIAKSVVYKFFPIFKHMGLNKSIFREKLNNYLQSLFNVRLMNFFPFTRDFYGNWKMNNKFQSPSNERLKQEYINDEKSYNFYRIFIEQLINYEQKTIFIKQEHLEKDLVRFKAIFENINLIAKTPQFSSFDFTHFYSENRYIDSSHPKKFEKAAVAKRIFDVVNSSLSQ